MDRVWPGGGLREVSAVRQAAGMGDAAKVIDWNGTDVPASIGDLLTGLPPGRYRVEVVPAEEDFELTLEQEEGIRAAMRQLDAGEGVPWETVHAELKARLDARPR